MVTKKQMAGLRALRMKARDERGRPYRNRAGEYNLVARVRSTRKGQRVSVRGKEVGVDGRSGKGFYVIREAQEGTQGKMRLYCNCPAQRFHYGYGKPCKHIQYLLDNTGKMIKRGEVSTTDIKLYNIEAVKRAAKVVRG